jgi:hypothetical protein
MTKDAYIEMEEMLGNEVDESKLPVELDDFPLEVIQAYTVYWMLRDEWDSMNGEYLGKSLLGLKDVMESCDIDEEDYKFTTSLVRLIDSQRKALIDRKRDQKPAK